MNFSEQLDQFVERVVNRYLAELDGHESKEEIYLAGSASLKPIVLKLYEALQAISEGTEGVDRDDHPSCGCMADEAMSEVEKLLIPHKEIKEFIDTVGNEPRRNKDNI